MRTQGSSANSGHGPFLYGKTIALFCILNALHSVVLHAKTTAQGRHVLARLKVACGKSNAERRKAGQQAIWCLLQHIGVLQGELGRVGGVLGSVRIGSQWAQWLGRVSQGRPKGVSPACAKETGEHLACGEGGKCKLSPTAIGRDPLLRPTCEIWPRFGGSGVELSGQAMASCANHPLLTGCLVC